MVVLAVVAVMLPQALVATQDAVRRVDPGLTEMSHGFRVPWHWRARHVVLPSVVPPVVAAVAITLSGGLRLGLMAGVLAAPDGIGAAVSTACGCLETARVFAWAGVAVLFAVAVDALVLRPAFRRPNSCASRSPPAARPTPTPPTAGRASRWRSCCVRRRRPHGLTGMHLADPLLVHGAGELTAGGLKAAADRYLEVLSAA